MAQKKNKLIKKSRIKKAQDGYHLSKVTGGNAAGIGAENPLATKQGIKNIDKLMERGMSLNQSAAAVGGNWIPGMA